MVSAGTKIPYLAFANDKVIFRHCSEDCLHGVKEFLSSYQSFSGQNVNVGKSSFLVSSRALPQQVMLVSSALGFQQQEFPIRYLGAPLVKGKLNSVACGGILSKLW